MNPIVFNRPFIAGKEPYYIHDAIYKQKALCGNGYYCKKSSNFIEKAFKIKKVLLTTSCTAALEMAAMLINIKPGDEVILPSFTFVSTANAFVIRNAVPVFVDIRPDTLNIDESKIEENINSRTKAIVVVHYAGVSSEMDIIIEIAKRYNLFVIEDAAQAVGASYKNKFLGSIGDFGTYSFHETKNFICGEGGALLINNDRFIERAQVLLEKGTNRNKFLKGQVDKYTWVDIGSSFVLSELNAAYLYGQLECKDEILKKRRILFKRYFEGLKPLQNKKKVKLPIIPKNCVSNGHIFYMLCSTQKERDDLIKYLKTKNIEAVFHYVPLHQSPMGMKFSKNTLLPETVSLSERIIRLPMFYSLCEDEQNYVINTVLSYYGI